MKAVVCESCEDFNSRDYKNYKPYQEQEHGYDWKDYFRWKTSNGVKIEKIPGTCHMCDIRKTGCIDDKTPRYYCKKGKRSIQTSLGDF